jgi:diamine N-acetyltransferase
MIRIEKVNGKNVWDLLKLKVSDEQRNFVASNDISIIEAYTAITGNGYAF